MSDWRGRNKWTLIHGRREFVWSRNDRIHGLVRNRKRLVHDRNILLVNNTADQRVTKCI